MGITLSSITAAIFGITSAHATAPVPPVQKAVGTIAAPAAPTNAYPVAATTPAVPNLALTPPKPVAAPIAAPKPATPMVVASGETVVAPQKRIIKRVAPVAPEVKKPAPVFVAPTLFDLKVRGDLRAALNSLRYMQPQLQIVEPSGKTVAVPVNVDVAGVSLIDAITAINESAGDKASLVYDGRDNSIRIAYRSEIEMGQTIPEEVKKWQAGHGAKPMWNGSGVLQHPYGAYQPEIVCAPLKVCDIELQPGEKLSSAPNIGDSVRWVLASARSGSDRNAVEHILIKPSAVGLDTNMVITTDRRTYHINLKSSTIGHVARTGFYYPQEVVADWSAKAELAIKGGEEEAQQKVAEISVPLDKLNFSYQVDPKADKDLRPLRVFDDGKRVYIQMPKSMESREAPSFMLLDKRGNSAIVNYRYNAPYYIVDKLFDRGALILGIDSDQKIVEIVRKEGWNPFD